MKIPTKLAMAALILLPSFAGGSPTDDAKIVVYVTTVKQGPLQIIGFKLPDKVGDAPVIVLRNMSDKPILDFRVATVVGNPEEDPGHDAKRPINANTNSTSLDWPLERAVPPNSDRSAHENALRSRILAAWGARLHSNCLHVAAIVHSVKFADGTTWQLENHEDEEIWKRSLNNDSTKSCDHSPAMEIALKQWRDGSAGNEQVGSAGNDGTGSPTHLDTVILQSYSVTCPLQNLGGKLAAICPW